MEIRIDFERLTQLREQLAKNAQVVREELLAAVTEADALLLREVKERTPRASGTLRSSALAVERVTGPFGVEGLVGSPLNYAAPVELGTKPHFPPVDALVDWVKTKLGIQEEKEARGVAFLVARKISREGTKGAAMFGEALGDMQPQVEAIFVRAQDRIATRLLGGSA